MRTVHYEHLTPGEIIEERRRLPVCYQPVGPLEWHGPHLPMGMDALNAAAIAAEVAVRLGGVVLPTLYWGSERERRPDMLRDIGFTGDEWIVGMDFPANGLKSLYTPEDVFGVVVRERLRLLAEQGYKLIVLVNGHGAENHIHTLARLAAEFTGTTKSTVLFPPILNPVEGDTTDLGHANLFETAVMLHLHPENVRLDTLPPREVPLRNVDFAIVDGAAFSGQPNAGHTVEQDPRDATPEQGTEAFERSVIAVAGHVRAGMARLFGS